MQTQINLAHAKLTASQPRGWTTQPKRQKSPQEDLNCPASTGLGAIYHQQGPERGEVTCEAKLLWKCAAIPLPGPDTMAVSGRTCLGGIELQLCLGKASNCTDPHPSLTPDAL